MPSGRSSCVIALRIAASTSSLQYMQPVFASITNSSPSAVETYTRPPTTTGCVPAELAPGNPKAHFSVSRGTSSAVIPAARADWKRVFPIPSPQPFQDGPASALAGGAVAALQNADFDIAASTAASGLPDTYAASARRCVRLRSA